MSKLLEAVGPATLESAGKAPEVLYSVHYEQCQTFPGTASNTTERIYEFPSFPVDLAFDDGVLNNVEDAWNNIMKHMTVDDTAQESQFMVFADRAGTEAEDY